ncbi:DUF7666 domain-containing protein [Phocaeicola vulgatus]|uniref:DUF7666 domain-containing protein n=1 Tax=Phocaeicola vulgatus TaxID=821 RepID=UPI00202E70AF|nr:hypothetical protein [Phocaeicola vulgatus]MCM1740807.1 hypothetical protein [Phocaeicola vulgatus]MCM1750292.1 hypothetical protein [Phocaeicola vulgatus]
MEQKIKAYKAFDKDLSCRGFKYKVGKEYEETGDIKACEKGFHACPYPLDVFGYYAPAGSRFCEVEQSGKIDDSESDKVCSSKIRIGAELDIRGLVKAAVSYVKERCTNEYNAEPGKPAMTGYRGVATAGYRGVATAGDGGVATAGDRGAATAGYRGVATAGDRGAATAGYRGVATARGKASTGSNGLSVARGKNVQVKGGIGAILVIAEERDDTYDIVDWKAVVVDGEVVKADTWYRLENGELVEVD